MLRIFLVASLLFLSPAAMAGENAPLLMEQLTSRPHPTPEAAVREAEELVAQSLRCQLIERVELSSPGVLAGHAIRLRGDASLPVLQPVPEMSALRVHEIRMTEIESSPVMYKADAEFLISRRQLLALGEKAKRYHLGLSVRLIGLFASVPIMLVALLYAFSLWCSVWRRLLLAVALIAGWGLLFLLWRVL